MPSASAARYDRWKAPAEDGQLLIWPQPAELLADARENHRRLNEAEPARLQGVALSDVRRQMRTWLGHDDDQILVASGHQAELHHPGVWAKNALMDAAAARLEGRAVHFAVDTDEPKHLQLRWPGGAVPLVDDPSAEQCEWSGLAPPPTPAHLNEAEREFERAAAHWSFRPLVPAFLGSMRRQSLRATNLPGALTDSLHQLDWDLGLGHDAMIVSPICFSEPYLLFVHHLLARAGEFGAQYNAALDQFRRENGIKAPGRPMPNMRLGDDACEVPFWLDSLSDGTRQRATVARSGGMWALQPHVEGGDEFRFDQAREGWDAAQGLGAWLRRGGLRLSPRALTLTAVLRLLVADQFVHGIGGGLYDQVLDALIKWHFQLEPPRFAVSTATLYFPDAIGRPRVCLPCIAQEGHRLKHAALGPEKTRIVEQIAALPRRSPQRSSLFYEMHERLSEAWRAPAVRRWEDKFREASEQAVRERALFDRELFYAIQPRERLTGLIEKYRQSFR